MSSDWYRLAEQYTQKRNTQTVPQQIFKHVSVGPKVAVEKLQKKLFWRPGMETFNKEIHR
jgi:hypothetical protein